MFDFIACDASAMESERAEYALTLGIRELMLCSHHMRQHRTAMALEGWDVSLIPSLPESMATEHPSCESVDTIFNEIMDERLLEYRDDD